MTERDLLRDMLKYLRQIEGFTHDGRENFVQDVKTQYAVIYAYQVVGEIAKRLPDEFRAHHPQIDWRKLITFRDFLAHNYEKIVVGPLWSAVEDLAQLIQAVEALAASLADPDES